MLVTPARGPAEARDNAAFDALLWSLSRPGLPRTLPEPGEASIIAALLDRECRVHAADPLLIPEIMRTGAELVDIEHADHVFFGTMTAREPLAQIATGSDLYPDGGATIILRARFGFGHTLRLTGPGVDGSATVQVGGLPDGFWAVRMSRLRYPMGFDLFLLDGDQVIGVPRSTTVEVL
ncbi:phosphonate C-P lyase system protein PhnH [uncultured Tateyamaria sp.]|uniref:phosphonate C-P lyase system protein PhnH n=1 Tax=uncultured Tateyamaria sp. TaxID=455651 RepID=UPI002631B11D|nr:phosphonate C-P lyase system protein PhnH [uncultured Tateyamaria sp.]